MKNKRRKRKRKKKKESERNKEKLNKKYMIKEKKKLSLLYNPCYGDREGRDEKGKEKEVI